MSLGSPARLLEQPVATVQQAVTSGSQWLWLLAAVLPLLLITVVFATVATVSVLSTSDARRKHSLKVLQKMTDFAGVLRGGGQR